MQPIQLSAHLVLWSPSPEATSALFASVAAAKASFGPIERTRTAKITPQQGAAYTYDYAPLDEIVRATTPGMSENGLAILQPPHVTDSESVMVTTMLTHKDGAFLQSSLSFGLIAKRRWQNQETEVPLRDPEIGAKITFMRRYQYQAILGIASEDAEEDEGLPVAQQQPQKKAEPPKQPRPTNTPPAPPPAKKPDAPKPAPKAEAKPEPKPEPTVEPPHNDTIPSPPPSDASADPMLDALFGDPEAPSAPALTTESRFEPGVDTSPDANAERTPELNAQLTALFMSRHDKTKPDVIKQSLGDLRYDKFGIPRNDTRKLTNGEVRWLLRFLEAFPKAYSNPSVVGK